MINNQKKWNFKKILFVFILVIAGINIINWVFIKPHPAQASEPVAETKTETDSQRINIATHKEFNGRKLLERGKIYIVSRNVPLMPELEPKDTEMALRNAKEIIAGGKVRIIDGIVKDKISLWYQVDVVDVNGVAVVSGWINSIALGFEPLAEFSPSVVVDKKMNDSVERERKPGQVFAADFGARWPLTVAKGLVCLNGQTCIFASRDEITKKVAMYHLSGPVIRSINIGDINTIMKPGKTVADLSELIEIAKKNPVPEK